MDANILDTVTEFFSHYPLKRVKKGQIIIYNNDDPSGIYYIVSGKIRQYDINYRGDEIVVNVFKPPAFFPMSWAINKNKNQYFFETIADTELRIAPPSDVTMFLKSHPEVMYDLLSRLYSGVDGLQRRMAHLMGGSAHSRILFELVVECTRFGELQKDGSYLLTINESELAQRAGLSRETVNRELARLKTRELLSHKGRLLSIKNIKSLQDELGDEL